MRSNTSRSPHTNNSKYSAIKNKNMVFARKSAGFSQAELAEKLHVTTRSVVAWEHGEDISISNLISLYEIYNRKYSFDFLLGYSDFTQAGNEEISKLTGLSDKAINSIRKWKSNSEPRTLKTKEGKDTKKTAPFSDGLAPIRLQMLNFLLENEHVGLLDTLWNCIFGKFLEDNKYIELSTETTVIGATNRTLQNAFIPSVTVCIEDLRDIAEHGQTAKTHQLIEKRHDAIAGKTYK